ncbi:MAG: TIGR03960 family B12-binding radical SAM protein [Deltaproteobacteria bacterium]|nr:TIGR03960 family B12-binding radical SAM protein [Deltaproteobacteria bacterium]TLN01702.1 MAG: TIGR03960 family B12-binding radical SAM protein [bacterium]
MQFDSLLSIEKPARYMGSEIGSVAKELVDVRFVLAFPDVYEVGMSHLGLQILYAILNKVEGIGAERVYAPWADREDAMRASGEVLATLETGTPLAATDIIGFTLQYEMSCTNILNMLELSGIPLLAAERGEKFPLILGGGPCAGNPEPLAEFFDIFLFGDGEDAILEIAEIYRDWKKAAGNKAALLESLSKVEGVYVPSFFSVSYHEDGRISEIASLKPGYEKVKRRIAVDLEQLPYPTSPVVPFLKTVHDRVSMEIARGCTRGCRFCQAGYLYRPVRERSPEKVLETIKAVLKNTGYDEISLLSLSAADYGCISDLLKTLMTTFESERVAVSLPSLRVGSLTRELIDEIVKVRKTGFTLAPEAGTERLRRVINKGITEEDLVLNSRNAYEAGWRVIKLYFMIGLPTETTEDVLGIAEMSAQVKRAGKGTGHGGDVTVSVGSFVPKPHTPFQWEPQISCREIEEKQRFLRGELRKRKLAFKWHDATLSFLEGVFARGDRRLARVLVEARKLGCRFDGWGEHHDFQKWQQAFERAGIDPEFYLRRRDPGEILPWDRLDCGVSTDFLLEELKKSHEEILTGDCRDGCCTECGVCNFSEVRMRLHQPAAVASSGPSDACQGSVAGTEISAVPPEAVDSGDPDAVARIRLRFTKTGAMSLLSHLELLHLFTRAVRRAQIPIRYSLGFHPHPKFSFATALSVGVESWAEYFDMEICAGLDPRSIQESLNAALPEGVRILEAAEIPLRSESLSVLIEAFRYRVFLPAGLVAALPEKVDDFLRLETYAHQRIKKGKTLEIDLRQELLELSATADVLEMVVKRGKPLEFAAAITGIPEEELRSSRIEKREVCFRPAS